MVTHCDPPHDRHQGRLPLPNPRDSSGSERSSRTLGCVSALPLARMSVDSSFANLHIVHRRSLLFDHLPSLSSKAGSPLFDDRSCEGTTPVPGPGHLTMIQATVWYTAECRASRTTRPREIVVDVCEQCVPNPSSQQDGWRSNRRAIARSRESRSRRSP